MATSGAPTTSEPERPNAAAGSGLVAGIRMTARSVLGSRPMISAEICRSSLYKVTETRAPTAAPATTWLLVSM